MFEIIKATPEHFQDIKDLITGIAIYEKMEDQIIWTDEQLYDEIFIQKNAKVIIAKEDEVTVGFALYFFNFSTFVGKKGLYLEDLFVKQEFRGKGYGKKLFVKLTQIAQEENCGRMEWVCLNWNQPSIEFYQSLHAEPLNEWTTWRLSEQQLQDFAKK